MKTRSMVAAGLGALFLLAGGGTASAAPPLSGAIFTTTVDGTVVNANVQYETKPDVYLDGGPGPNAPSTAAGLPAGDYYFQVTDPSGKDLLSSDHISCRRIHVSVDGVINSVSSGTNYVKQQGKWAAVTCQHVSGVDADHSAAGAITVQLFPYDDTPNPGGVYKAWVTPIGDYAGDPNLSCSGGGPCNVSGENYQPANVHGFIPSKTKTDNYKVKKNGKPFVPPTITVRKFHDHDFNCVQDQGVDEDITGWAVDVTDPTTITNTVYTPDTVIADPKGNWTFLEATPAGTLQTASYRDGSQISCYPDADPTVVVTVAGSSEETHTVAYGNVGLGSIKACKIYDRDADGAADAGEPAVSGWNMQLTGTDTSGASVGPTVQATGGDGCTTFGSLLPGAYTVTELVPASGGWQTVGATSANFTIESSLDGASLTGTAETVTFANFCLGTAGFGTKGYWHNQNGLAEMTDGDIDYANGLAPYSSPSSYFDAGDEPFDGVFSDGTAVAAASGPAGELLAAAGTARAEVSSFLIDSNANGDPREQLAQQLLAFIFNSRNRLDDPGAAIQLPDGTWVSASSLIDEAIFAWSGTDADLQHALEQLLDALNNMHNDGVSPGVTFVHFDACAVAY